MSMVHSTLHLSHWVTKRSCQKSREPPHMGSIVPPHSQPPCCSHSPLLLLSSRCLSLVAHRSSARALGSNWCETCSARCICTAGTVTPRLSTKSTRQRWRRCAGKRGEGGSAGFEPQPRLLQDRVRQRLVLCVLVLAPEGSLFEPHAF